MDMILRQVEDHTKLVKQLNWQQQRDLRIYDMHGQESAGTGNAKWCFC